MKHFKNMSIKVSVYCIKVLRLKRPGSIILMKCLKYYHQVYTLMAVCNNLLSVVGDDFDTKKQTSFFLQIYLRFRIAYLLQSLTIAIINLLTHINFRYLPLNLIVFETSDFTMICFTTANNFNELDCSSTYSFTINLMLYDSDNCLIPII